MTDERDPNAVEPSELEPGLVAAVLLQHRELSGFPSSATLDALERHAPGSVQQIVTEALEDLRYQRDFVQQEQRWVHRLANRGQILGFIFVMFALGISGTAMLLNTPWYVRGGGILVSISTIAYISALFILGREPRRSPEPDETDTNQPSDN